MNPMLTDGEWSYLRQAAMDLLAEVAMKEGISVEVSAILLSSLIEQVDAARCELAHQTADDAVCRCGHGRTAHLRGTGPCGHWVDIATNELCMCCQFVHKKPDEE